MKKIYETLQLAFNLINLLPYLGTVYESMKRSGLFAIFEPSTVFISLSDAFSFAEDSVRIHSQRNNGKDDHLDTNPIDSDGI